MLGVVLDLSFPNRSPRMDSHHHKQSGEGKKMKFNSVTAAAARSFACALDGMEPDRAIAGLAWVSGAPFATLQNAVVRIAPVN